MVVAFAVYRIAAKTAFLHGITRVFLFIIQVIIYTVLVVYKNVLRLSPSYPSAPFICVILIDPCRRTRRYQCLVPPRGASPSGPRRPQPRLRTGRRLDDLAEWIGVHTSSDGRLRGLAGNG